MTPKLSYYQIFGASAILIISANVIGCKKSYSTEELKQTAESDYKKSMDLYIRGTSSMRYMRRHFEARGEQWVAASEAGIPQGQFLHAQCCRKEIGMESNPAKAFALYEKSAKAGIPRAMVRLGLYYRDGGGPVAVDTSKAKEWFLKAHESGFPPGTRFLAAHFLGYGKQEDRDVQRGLQLLKQAFSDGCGPAGFDLGIIYHQGKLVPEDVPRALALLKRASDLGSFLASNELARIYADGLGVPKDPKRSHSFLAKAAEQGLGRAAFFLSNRLETGWEFVEKDGPAAFEWMRMAAEECGYLEAMVSLGNDYAEGLLVSKDLDKAAEWYAEASDRGSLNGTFNLAHCYLGGEGVNKDPQKAVKLLQKAVEGEHDMAMNSLGVIYMEGKLVPREHQRAISLWQGAAALGNKDAQRNLAAMRPY